MRSSCPAARLRTLDVIVPLEKEIGAPVVSSTPHGLMNGVRMLGVNPRVQGFGMVFAPRLKPPGRLKAAPS